MRQSEHYTQVRIGGGWHFQAFATNLIRLIKKYVAKGHKNKDYPLELKKFI